MSVAFFLKILNKKLYLEKKKLKFVQYLILSEITINFYITQHFFKHEDNKIFCLCTDDCGMPFGLCPKGGEGPES